MYQYIQRSDSNKHVFSYKYMLKLKTHNYTNWYMYCITIWLDLKHILVHWWRKIFYNMNESNSIYTKAEDCPTNKKLKIHARLIISSEYHCYVDERTICFTNFHPYFEKYDWIIKTSQLWLHDKRSLCHAPWNEFTDWISVKNKQECWSTLIIIFFLQSLSLKILASTYNK